MSDSIKKSEVVDDNILKGLIKEASDLLPVIEANSKAIDLMANNLEKISKIEGKSLAQIINLNNAYKQSNELMNDKEKIDSAREKMLDQIAKAQERLNSLSTDEAVKLAEVREQIKEKNKQMREQVKRTMDLTKEQLNELGTLEKLEKQNTRLRLERKKLNLETDTGRKRLEEINAELDKNNAFIKANSDSLAAQRMNVGNYTDSVKDAISESGIFSRQLSQLNRIQKTLNTLLQRNTAATTAQAQATTVATKTTGGLSKALKFLRVALIATGIGAIVVILGSLISYLTGTQEGVDKVTSVLRPLGTVLQSLIGVLQNFGKTIFKAFTDPVGTIKAFGKLIQDQVLNRMKAVVMIGQSFAALFRGDFSDAVDLATDGMLQLVTGVENAWEKLGNLISGVKDFTSEAWKLGQQIDFLTKKLRDLSIANIVPLAKLRVEYEQIMERANDSLLTERQRIDALYEAEEIVRQINKRKLAEVNTEIELLLLRQKQNATLLEGAESIRTLRELEAKRLELEAEMQSKINGLVRRRSNLEKTAQENAFKRNQAVARLSEIEQELNIQRRQRLIDEAIREGVHVGEIAKMRRELVELEIALQETKYANDIKEARGNKTKLKELELRHIRAMEVIQEGYADFVRKLGEDNIKLERKSKAELYEMEAAELERLSRQRTLINLRTIEDDKELAEAERNNTLLLLDQKIEARKKHGLDVTELEIQRLELMRNVLEEEADLQKQVLAEVSDFATQTAKDVGNAWTDQLKIAAKQQEQIAANSQMMFNSLSQAAAEGNIEASKSLKAYQDEAREAQLRQIELEKRQQAIKQATAALDIFNQQIQAGENPATALANTSTYLASVKALTGSVAGFFTGTDYLGRGDGAKPFFNSNKDNYLIRAEGGERIVPAAINRQLGGITNDMLPELINRDLTGQTMVVLKSKDDQVINEIKGLRSDIRNQPNYGYKLEETLSGLFSLVSDKTKRNATVKNRYKA